VTTAAPRRQGGLREACFRLSTPAAGSTLEDDINFDVLVCDDMGTEIADFIGVDSATRRVADPREGVQDNEAALGECLAGGECPGIEEPRVHLAVRERYPAESQSMKERLAKSSREGRLPGATRHRYAHSVVGSDSATFCSIRSPRGRSGSCLARGRSEPPAEGEQEGSAQGRSDPDALLPPSDLGRRLVSGCTPSRSVLA